MVFLLLLGNPHTHKHHRQLEDAYGDLAWASLSPCLRPLVSRVLVMQGLLLAVFFWGFLKIKGPSLRVLIIRALVFGVNIRFPYFRNLPYP